MIKADKRESIRAQRAEQGSLRALRAGTAHDLRAKADPPLEQTGLHSSKELDDIQIQHEVAVLLRDASKVRFDENRIERELVSEGRLHDREEFENLCDEVMTF